jgi:AbrB family looped-hinge helix DNA binding protein
LTRGELGLPLRLKVGKKGYIILPKALREAVGIEEGDEAIVEIKDGILLKPLRKVDVEKLRNALRKHANRLRIVKGRKEPKPGELSQAYLEEEFEN